MTNGLLQGLLSMLSSIVLLKVTANCAEPCNSSYDHPVRLENGPHGARAGFIRVCLDDFWGYVCDDRMWDTNDALVVCRQLEFEGTDTSTRILSLSNDTVTLDSNSQYYRLSCTGNEISVEECQPETVQCFGSTAGVFCPLNTTTAVEEECNEDGSLQLRQPGNGALSISMGVVHVCLGGRWFQVCDNKWTEEDATVVCRQLGYSGVNTTLMFSDSKAFTTYFWRIVTCNGDESTIVDCESRNKSQLTCESPLMIGGVICDTTSATTTPDEHTVPTTTPDEHTVPTTATNNNIMKAPKVHNPRHMCQH